jgi:alkanesulfonate monooxygenase SsuD/methylene tetrahydromethanopterin reductase-like flavin-dependent oxidoreductase (luciferase family)
MTAPLAPRRRPRVGLILDQEEEPGQAAPRWRDMLEFAMSAEAIGIDSLWLVDHFIWSADPWGRADGAAGAGPLGVWEAWTTLAALAGTTSRMRLGTLVACTGYRNPALLAKMAETVDEISGGRLILGLGAGDYPGEHRRFGIPFDRPVHRFEEALSIIVPLLRTGSVDFEGEIYSARDCVLRPRGPRPGGPPILIGSLGNGPRVLRLVAQHADIWNGWIPDRSDAAEVPALRDAVDAACRIQGRDPLTLRRTVAVAVAFSGPMSERPGSITGTMEEIADALHAFGAEGIEEVQIRLFPNDRATVERLGEILVRLDA